MRVFRVSEEPLRGVHDSGDAGFVVRAEKCAAIGADDVFPDMASEFREYFRIQPDFVFRIKRDCLTVPGLCHLRMNAFAGGFGGRIHVGIEENHRRFFSSGRRGNRRGHHPFLGECHILRAECPEFRLKDPREIKFPCSARGGCAFRI